MYYIFCVLQIKLLLFASVSYKLKINLYELHVSRYEFLLNNELFHKND